MSRHKAARSTRPEKACLVSQSAAPGVSHRARVHGAGRRVVYHAGMLLVNEVLVLVVFVSLSVGRCLLNKHWSALTRPASRKPCSARGLAPLGGRSCVDGRCVVLCLGVCVALPSEVGAQGRLVDAVASGPIAVEVDLTDDDCALRAELIRAEAELTLRRAGLDVAERATPLNGFVFIHGADVGNSTFCTVTVSFYLLLLGSRVTLDGAVLVEAPIIAVIRGNRSEVMRDLRTNVNEVVTVWANDLQRARARSSPD